jgi:hypothetical protein
MNTAMEIGPVIKELLADYHAKRESGMPPVRTPVSILDSPVSDYAPSPEWVYQQGLRHGAIDGRTAGELLTTTAGKQWLRHLANVNSRAAMAEQAKDQP